MATCRVLNRLGIAVLYGQNQFRCVFRTSLGQTQADPAEIEANPSDAEQQNRPRSRRKKQKGKKKARVKSKRIKIDIFNFYMRHLILEVDQHSNNSDVAERMAKIIKRFQFWQVRHRPHVEKLDEDLEIGKRCLLHTITFRVTVPSRETRKREKANCFDMFGEDSCIQTAIYLTCCRRLRFTLLEPSRNTTARTTVLNPRERPSYLIHMSHFYSHIHNWFTAGGVDHWGKDRPMVEYRKAKIANVRRLVRNLKGELWKYVRRMEKPKKREKSSESDDTNEGPSEDEDENESEAGDDDDSTASPDGEWIDDVLESEDEHIVPEEQGQDLQEDTEDLFDPEEEDEYFE